MKGHDLKEFIEKLGISDVGFSDVGEVVPPNWSKYHYAITLVLQLSNGIIDDITDEPTDTYFSHYRSVNNHLNEVMLKTTIALQNCGFAGIPIPASQSLHNKPYYGVFPHKTAATIAGLGWIGKSALFIHHKYGPRVRLGTVLTNMELPVERPPVTESSCGNCKICMNSCPAMAIEGQNWIRGMERKELYDAHGCSTYMKEHYQHIGRGSVCGICIKTCPIGGR